MEEPVERRVAVIAIHGVNEQVAGDMARSVGNLLGSLRDGDVPRYCTFGQSPVRLSVSGVKVNQHITAGGRFNWGPLDRLFKLKSSVRPAADNVRSSIDHLFMEGQLSGFQAGGPEATYESLRLEGYRYSPGSRSKDGTSDRRVHIYDMSWSDLSGVAASGFRVFGEIYQILFHLGSIGVNNVRAAALSLPKIPAWRTFSSWQKFAVGGLAWPIPLLNLILLGLALTLFSLGALRQMEAITEAVVSAVICLVTAIALAGYGLSRARRLPWWVYAASIIGLLVVLTAVCVGLFYLPSTEVLREAEEYLDGSVILATLAAGIYAVVNNYEKRRPSTKLVLAILVSVWGLLTVVAIAATERPHYFRAMYLLLRGLEVALLLLGLAWLLFSIGMAGACITGAIAVWRTKDPAEKSRAKRTNWTARLSLILPTSLFLLMTFAVWAGVLRLGIPLVSFPAADCSLHVTSCLKGDQLCYSPLTMPNATSPLTVSEVVGKGFLVSGIGFLPFILGALIVAALFSLWTFFPSVLAELSPPTGDASGLTGQSKANHLWLSNGFRLMRWGGEVLYGIVFLFFPFVAMVLVLVFSPGWEPSIRSAEEYTLQISTVLGFLVAGATASLLGFSGKLSRLALGLRPIVRVALDVDNWLRENPRGTNPTARISARFISVLRYVLQWRDEKGRGYDSIVIFAHSQGTVIVTDILRYLHVEARECGGYGEYDESLARMEGIGRYLLTMGCPLKQLYGLRFPYLYGYAASDSGATHPNAGSMGIEQWTNAFRSGDYVGRELWSDGAWEPSEIDAAASWDPCQGVPKATYRQDKAVEYPIGIGAHTHYWDATALPIALILDDLIANA